MLSTEVEANTLRDGELLPERESTQRSELVLKMKFVEFDVSAKVGESREACKRLRKLGILRKTVATHHLKELIYLRAVEKLVTWRMSYGFDRCDIRDDQWVHGPLPPTAEQTTANMWAAVNALKDAISATGKNRSRQRVDSFINELEQGIASLTDEEFIRLKRMIVERRGRAAAHVVVAPIDTAQPCNPQSRSSKISFDTRSCIKRNIKGRMDPERSQLESPSAGTGFETPGQQGLPNWEIGRTTVDGCLLAGVSSNLGKIRFPSHKPLSGREPVAKHRLHHQTQFSCRRVTNLETASQLAKETSSSTPGGKEGNHSLKKRMHWYSFRFLGGTRALGARLVSFVFASLRILYLLCIVLIRGLFFCEPENMGKREENQWRRESSR